MAAALLPLSFLFGRIFQITITYSVNIGGMTKFLGAVITQALKAVVTVLRQRNHIFTPAEISTVFLQLCLQGFMLNCVITV